MLRVARFLLAPVLLLAIALGVLLLTSKPATAPIALTSLGSAPLVIAHRGGKGLWPENTLFAFQRAAALDVDMVEMDIRRTLDGQLAVIHDADVARTTNGSGAVAQQTLAQLQQLDAGYQWTADGGESYPYRNQGIRIPALAEVLAQYPRIAKSVELKDSNPLAAEQLCQMLQEANQLQRVVVSSFHEPSLQAFREHCPAVATGAGPTSAKLWVVLHWLGLERLLSPSYQVLAIPEERGAMKVDAALVQDAQARGLAVHLWTINEQPAMRHLLDMGAQGLITDYPDRALQLLGRPTVLGANQP
ncbi:glycerophosphodiester phosphodiesterase [Pseudomonas turukhanskensis]|uniref:Glycerophosphoryl diester phosphodiesterase YhdW n=1 Tax=Pseudomonas turukhanskensis TaxID=1806536 RepID=A0A9W6K4P5_9PSED|nr:glycerophosphodiester phosphodiesterase [Pseudomonas turukhanskensis]GLK87695.1 putative glycerophosphoryl diester phosphodiesterase YhdW [Pseudomonas turukhanskensis]